MTAGTAEPSQLPLDLDWPRKRALQRRDFIEGACNAEALAAVEGWQGWKDGRLVLIGAEGSGKTHLAAIWAEWSGASFVDVAALDAQNIRDVAALDAVILEDADQRLAAGAGRDIEVALLHLFNVMGEAGGRMLFTARVSPRDWPVDLPDLATRLRLPPVFKVGTPDETVLSHLIVKLFDDRSVVLDPKVAAFIALRIGRSFSAVHGVVERLDRQSVAEKKPVTIKMVKDVFEW